MWTGSRAKRHWAVCVFSVRHVGQLRAIEVESDIGSSYARKGAEMRSRVERNSKEAEKTIRDVQRATRRQYSVEQMIEIVIAG